LPINQKIEFDIISLKGKKLNLKLLEKMPDIFKKFQGKEIRTFVDLDTKELWFVAKDVANILSYDQTSNMLKRLDIDEIQKIEPSILDGSNSKARKIALINESGIYIAIFGSKKENAKEFKKWLTKDVLPSIRKNGFYISPESLKNPSKKLIRFSSSIMETRKATILKRDKLYSRIEKFLDSETGYKENSLNRVVSTVYQHLHIATSLKTAVLVIQDNLINSKDGLKINSYNPKQKKPYDKDYIVAMNYYNEKQLKLFDSYFLGILEDVIKHLDSPHTLPTSKSVIKILKDSGIRQIKLVTELDLGTTFQGKVRTEIDELVDEYKKEKMEYPEMVKRLEKLRTGKIFKI